MTDRLTDAEKLENAIEQMADVLASFRRTELTRSANELRDVVARMRESRKPKPKWRRLNSSTADIVGPGIFVWVAAHPSMSQDASLTNIVADLLNKADPA